MKITKFKTLRDDAGLPYLVKIQEYEHQGWLGTKLTFNDIVRIMVDTLHINKETEEYGYELCFDVKMRLIGIFEISHGDLKSTTMTPREIFQKALWLNAACIILVHNHPSGSCKPSNDDELLYEQLLKAGDILNIPVFDSIIIGDTEAFTMAGERAIIW